METLVCRCFLEKDLDNNCFVLWLMDDSGSICKTEITTDQAKRILNKDHWFIWTELQKHRKEINEGYFKALP